MLEIAPGLPLDAFRSTAITPKGPPRRRSPSIYGCTDSETCSVCRDFYSAVDTTSGAGRNSAGNS